MIAGETKKILAGASQGAYDNFLFGKKKKKQLSPQEKQAKKEKRRRFWRDVAGEFKEGSTSKNIAELFAGGAAAPPHDYQVDVGTDEKKPPPEPSKKGVPTIVIVIGGVVILSVAVYGISTYRSRQLKAA